MEDTLVLETHRLRMEPITDNCADEWWQAVWSDHKVARFLPPARALERPEVDARVNRAIRAWGVHGFGIFTLRDRRDGYLLGHCGLVVNEPPNVELVYALTRHAWGRGLATEASARLLDHAFKQLGLESVFALVVPENTASVRVLDKLKFVPDGKINRDQLELLRFVCRRE